MVVQLAQIPWHIQLKIADKMDMKDFRCFRESSKHGRELGSCVRVAMGPFNMLLGQSRQAGVFEPKIGNHLLSSLRNHENCPRFLIESIVKHSNEMLMEMIQAAENGTFIGNDTSLFLTVSNREHLDPMILKQVAEIYTVTTIVGIPVVHQAFVHELRLHQFKKVELSGAYGVETVLAFNAPHIEVVSDSTNISYPLKNYFGMWFANNRHLSKFSLTASRGIEWNLDLHAIFGEYNFKWVWSPETHNSSSLSDFSPEDLSDWRFKDSIFLTIENGSGKLLVRVSKTCIFSEMVINPEQELLNYLPDHISRKRQTNAVLALSNVVFPPANKIRRL